MHFAKTATSFTRTQAHAIQVYEALVLAPVRPSDIGLKRLVENGASGKQGSEKVKIRLR